MGPLRNSGEFLSGLLDVKPSGFSMCLLRRLDGSLIRYILLERYALRGILGFTSHRIGAQRRYIEFSWHMKTHRAATAAHRHKHHFRLTDKKQDLFRRVRSSISPVLLAFALSDFFNNPPKRKAWGGYGIRDDPRPFCEVSLFAPLFLFV